MYWSPTKTQRRALIVLSKLTIEQITFHKRTKGWRNSKNQQRRTRVHQKRHLFVARSTKPVRCIALVDGPYYTQVERTEEEHQPRSQRGSWLFNLRIRQHGHQRAWWQMSENAADADMEPEGLVVGEWTTQEGVNGSQILTAGLLVHAEWSNCALWFMAYHSAEICLITKPTFIRAMNTLRTIKIRCFWWESEPKSNEI